MHLRFSGRCKSPARQRQSSPLPSALLSFSPSLLLLPSTRAFTLPPGTCLPRSALSHLSQHYVLFLLRSPVFAGFFWPNCEGVGAGRPACGSRWMRAPEVDWCQIGARALGLAASARTYVRIRGYWQCRGVSHAGGASLPRVHVSWPPARPTALPVSSLTGSRARGLFIRGLLSVVCGLWQDARRLPI